MRNLTVFLTILCLSLTLYSCQPAAPQDAISEEAAEELVTKTTEVWNTADAELAKEVYTEDFKRTTPEGNQNGHEEFMAAVNQLHSMYSDVKISNKEVFLDGHHLTLTWTASGTNTGPLGEEMPATGETASVDGASIFTLSDEGKIMEERAFYDVLTIYQQLGFTLQPPQMASAQEEEMGEEEGEGAEE